MENGRGVMVDFLCGLGRKRRNKFLLNLIQYANLTSKPMGEEGKK